MQMHISIQMQGAMFLLRQAYDPSPLMKIQLKGRIQHLGFGLQSELEAIN